jgi:hypothetical protein
MSYGILDAAKDLVLGGPEEFATETEVESRQAICNGCDKKNKLGVCTECWCVIKYKTQMKKASCPLNKW